MEQIRNKYIWIITPYFFTIGVLYLFAYWSFFNINVFEFANFSDLLRVSIIPVSSAFFFVLIGMFLSQYTLPKFPEGEGSNTKIGKFLNKIKWLGIIFYWVLLLLLIFSNNENKWITIPFFAMFFPYLILKDTPFLQEIKSDSIRSLLIMSFSILPIFSFCQGKINANKILNNKEYKYLESVAEVSHAKFLGYIGEYLIFSSFDNSKIILQKIPDEAIILIQSNELKK
ncbi:hypothetical protein KKG81_14270 [bacterium]|nr:hypothetical protein [bacterium]